MQALLFEGVEAAGTGPTAELWWERDEGFAELKSPAGMLEGMSIGERVKLSLVQGERGQSTPPGPSSLE